LAFKIVITWCASVSVFICQR